MRFLLSHNYSITEESAPPLSREEFYEVFQGHLTAALGQPCQVTLLNHPHWRCAISTETTAEPIGVALAATLKQARENQIGKPINYKILALGGLKTTPATSTSPAALQPGEWGVDVVETIDDVSFLQTIGWDKLIAERTDNEVFQVII